MNSTTSDTPIERDEDFAQSLRNLRTQGEQRRQRELAREARARHEQLDAQLQGLEGLTVLRKRFAELAADFIAEAPGFETSCRLFDGRYLLELSARDAFTDAHGRSRRALSRLGFLVRSAGGCFDVDCHKTVADHDLTGSSLQASQEPAVVEGELCAFLDAEFLEFAEAYYAALGRGLELSPGRSPRSPRA